jgi:methionine synthase II (cobalamin-independent)
MFATLLGGLPRPPLPDDAPIEAVVEAVVLAQSESGLEPITDGGFWEDLDPIRAWRTTSSMTDRPVKQVLTGPYSFGHDGRAAGSNASDRTEATLARATLLNATIRDLADAGCPLIEIHEPAATGIGTDLAERALFSEAHLRLLHRVDGAHISLALTGGSAHAAGIETILSAPYASLAVDLIAGPDNWRLVTVAPTQVGIVCGALSAAAGSFDGPEVLLWAAGYAASTQGRGPQRVGLATASSLAHLPWAAAVRKLERLGEAARLADLPPNERVMRMDPRAVSIRSAALGRVEPRPSRAPNLDDDST